MLMSVCMCGRRIELRREQCGPCRLAARAEAWIAGRWWRRAYAWFAMGSR